MTLGINSAHFSHRSCIYKSCNWRAPRYKIIGRFMLLCSMCSIMPFIGAKPVPPATNTMGWLESSRKKKLPNGASKRKIAFSCSSLAAYSLNTPPGITRICSCKKSLSCGALAIENARRLPSFKINSIYWPAKNCKRSLAGNCKCSAITS